MQKFFLFNCIMELAQFSWWSWYFMFSALEILLGCLMFVILYDGNLLSELGVQHIYFLDLKLLYSLVSLTSRLKLSNWYVEPRELSHSWNWVGLVWPIDYANCFGWLGHLHLLAMNVAMKKFDKLSYCVLLNWKGKTNFDGGY